MSTTTGESQLPSPAPSLGISKVTRGHSCVSCQRRKVRCNGQKPCSTCIKTGLECVTAAPSPLRQRKARLSTLNDDGGSQRRRPRLDDIRLRNSLATKSPESERMDVQYITESRSLSPGCNKNGGTMIFERGHQRYIEKYDVGRFSDISYKVTVTDDSYSNLWTGISDEVKISPELLFNEHMIL